MADLTLKRFDTYPPLTVTLSDGAGPINLTAASSVHMEMKSSVGTILASLGMIIASTAGFAASGPGGVIMHGWVAAETSMVDTWSAEWEILWQAGGVQTVPNDGQKSIAIIPDIEGT